MIAPLVIGGGMVFVGFLVFVLTNGVAEWFGGLLILAGLVVALQPLYDEV